MKSLDYGIAALLFIVVVGVGCYWMWPNLGAQLEDGQQHVEITNARIADDQAWLKQFPVKQREQRSRMQPLNIDEMTSAEGVVEERFTASLATLLHKNHIAFRKLTFDPAFQADPQTMVTPTPGPGQAPVPVPSGATGETIALANAPAAGNGNAGAAGGLAVRRRAYLVRDRVEVEIVAPYAQNLETLAEISGLPVLTEVVSAKMSRDRIDDSSKNPMIDSDDVLYVYRLVRQ